MTFHGMKPYDNALPQEREWEQQADIYGYIVCAPQLSTSDSFMQYPLNKEHSYVLRDKENVIAIMDHVFATTRADPQRVLSTSWSCGGYLAHYFPNRFPDRFSCIATRLSNFSAKLLLEETVPLYRDRVPVAIFIGDGDFPACKSESEEAVAWYTARNFRVVRGKTIDRMGHRRIPQTAAAFFAEQLGIKPLRPVEAAMTLASVQMTEYHPTRDLIAEMSPPSSLLPPTRALARRNTTRAAAAQRRTTEPNPPSIRPPKRRTVAYNCTNAGTKYPAGKTPVYNPMPESRPRGRRLAQRDSVAASAAGATRVASAADRQRSSNWLEPIKGQDAKPQDPRNTTAAEPKTPTPSNNRRADTDSAPDRSAERTTSESPRINSRTDRTPVARRTADASGGATKPLDASWRPPPRPFRPQEAGPREYDVLGARRNHQRIQLARRTTSRSPATASAKRSRKPVADTKSKRKTPTEERRVASAKRPGKRQAQAKPDTDRSRSPHAPKRRPEQTKGERITIRLSGPAIGRAPHWIGYSVELPRSVTEGADFLWRDNGVWIGDEPRGVKILETPGLHKITVLMVAKDNRVYRGHATVQVLEPYPSGRASASALRR
jgi:hypothetical protein